MLRTLINYTLALITLTAIPLSAVERETGPARAFALEDLDLQKSALFDKGARTPLDEDMFRDRCQAGYSKGPQPEVQTAPGWQLLLAFKRPVALGTALLSAGGLESSHFVAQALKQEFTGALEKATDKDWESVAAAHTFPGKYRTRAVRLVATRDYRGPLRWLFWQPRLVNLTPLAVGSGERAPFGAHPNALPRGEAWFNTGKDWRPGAPKQIQRGPISEALPSWYVLSWDAPQTLDGVWLSSNADKFSLLAYRGPEGLNPAVAPDTAWRRVEFKTLHEQPGGGERLTDRLVQFPSLKTIALKLEMTSCQRGPVATVAQMAALADERHLPPSKPATAAGSQGKEIAYQQPFDGQLAMVITDQEGRTIRNLVAQVDRRKGPGIEHWDLKNEEGLTVPPGKYRWKAITSPPLGLRYQLSVYPNAPQLFPGQTPWLTGESGANGWLADHASITSGTTCGDKLYFGAPGVESGVCLIECDLTGRKQWAKHSFGPFSGVGRLAADDRHVYIQERDSLHRLDPESHKIERIAGLTSAERQGEITGLAAHGGQVVVALSSPIPWVDNATRADMVDLENCLPKFAARIADPLGTRRVQPNPRVDFLRLLRLTGAPAGQGAVSPDRREAIFPITIDTAGSDDDKSQYVLLAFHEPVPLGSVVLPCVGPEFQVDLSVLKSDAPYPPNPREESHWQACPEQPRAGWTCVPMPPQARTQGLRIRVRRTKDAGETDLIDDILAEKKKKPKKTVPDLDLDRPLEPGIGKTEPGSKAAHWFARFEGVKLLRRRFTDITAEAKVRVNSGEVNKQGEWDAQRTTALSPDDPGIYVLQWTKPQSVAALAIKEIDGAVTEVDVWDDKAAPGGEVPLADAPQWKHVATYRQSRRDAYEPSFDRNDNARYLDGYVSLGSEVSTRAVRLRVVSQWADNSDRGTASLRADQGGRSLDPRRCRIWGVAALKYLGDEPPLDTLAYQRLEIRDGQSGKLVREIVTKPDATPPSSLAFRADGALFGVQGGRVVQIDTATGATSSVLPGIDGEKVTANRLAVGADGAFYVHDFPDQLIRVYNQAGKQLRTLGHPGGQSVGPWDPEKFRRVENLVADASGQLWVVESQDLPRRIVQYDAKGRFANEFYGNTHYGGGGVLDPADKTRLFYGHIEFAIDWKTGKSRIKNMLAQWLPEDCVPIRYSGNTYLVTTPLSYSATQAATVVYRYDETRGIATLAAAFGEANAFEPLKTPRVLEQLAGGKVAKDYTFLWSDTSGNGEVDPDEVTFELKPSPSNLQLGRCNDRLRCWAGAEYYQPKSVLPSGVPVFERVASPAPRAGSYELASGDLLALQAESDRPMQHGDGRSQETRGIDQAGQVRWRYSTEHPGVSGLYLPPWEAGYVSNEFGVIGHGTASKGDLGEYVVIHGNNGQWKIWTADGFLAGQILRHKFDPRSIVESSTAKAGRDLNLDNLTGGQEHFHGYFAQTPDGRAYIVHGHNYIGISEVLGLDRFRRLAGEVTVTPEDVQQVRRQHEEIARREAKSQALVLECLRVTDGKVPEVAERDGIHFGMGYDDQWLYVRWNVSGHGTLRNSGDDFHRYFKTGACLDLQLGLDPQANAARNQPVLGDLRLLFTVAGEKPQAVLYQPVVAKPLPAEAWETRTDAGGTTRFDRVVQLKDAKLDYSPDRNGGDQFTYSARIPLKALNWQPEDGQLLRCDWGVLASDDGHTVKRRIYWSNSLATGTTDEAWEARLDPHLWGTLAVVTKSRAERQLELASPEGKGKPREDDILDDLDSKK